jgi:Mn-dependent DtxR family transcriptional regulator
MEDYLEMIYRLVQEKGYVRAVDLSECLGVQSSSVTRMIQKLNEAGFISYEKYRNIALTPLGERYGRFLVWRDTTLEEFFTLLNAEHGVEEQVEGIEHYITPPTMSLIRNLITYFKENPDALDTLHALQHIRSYPDEEDLKELRAWEFRHNTE